jgi:hypothetical protein
MSRNREQKGHEYGRVHLRASRRGGEASERLKIEPEE